MRKIIIPVLLIFLLGFNVNGKPVFRHIGDYVASSIISDINKTNKQVNEQSAKTKR